MHLSIRVRTGRLPFLSGHLQVRHHTSSRPRHEDAIHVSRFVVGTLLTFGTLGFGLYSLRNATFDRFRPLTLGPVPDMTHSGSDHSRRHVHHHHKAIDSPSDSQAVPSSIDTPTSVSSLYGTLDDVERAIEALRRALPGELRVQTNKDTLSSTAPRKTRIIPLHPIPSSSRSRQRRMLSRSSIYHASIGSLLFPIVAQPVWRAISVA